MKYCKVTAFLDGEAVVEPEVPVCCLPLIRWIVRWFGGTIFVGEVRDTKEEKS